ncbi:MAG: lipid-A-disaccharide synthase N-terminal domain-containing protein [Phycisphaerae bacterium]|nr:lipid-A-disaccharide synthase N-terminal domain-containing protein [Phycisphaerae bacterium]
MRRNPVFRVLNITSWANVVWVGIGLGGQIAFSGRMLLQWFISERRRESVITESFWWFSLFGALALFSYFVWRQDPVGILGQASGIVIYARNLRLIHKRRRRMARNAAGS